METILKKEIISHKALTKIVGILVFIILTALGAFVRIPLPFSPVPITLQTFFVLLSGVFLGAGCALTSQAAYLTLGLLGLPLFTGTGSGLLYLFGPTGGYLLSFPLVSFFISRFIKYIPCRLLPVLGLFFSGSLIILVCGIIWLKIIFGYNLLKLLFIGFIPFLPGDLLKALIASFLYLKLKSRLQVIF
jgi:biotin transport system substrate-specific component